MPDSHLQYYTFVYPHPDHPACGYVELPLDFIKLPVAHLLSRAREDYPEIPTHPQPKLYKPSGLVIDPRETLVERTRQWLKENLDYSTTVELNIISEVYPADRDLHDLSLIIVTPEIKESLDAVGNLDPAHAKAYRDRETGMHAANKALPSPSNGVDSFSALKSLFMGNRLHAGRPAGNYGLPVALFNPILGLLAHRLSRLQSDIPEICPDHHERRQAHEFILASLGCYDNEDTRLLAILPFIASLDPTVLVEWKKTVNGIKPDAMLGSAVGFPYAVVELKNESGLEGDASIEARLSYAKIVTADNDEIKHIRKMSNCPAVVIGLMGDFVEIGITVYTDGPYSDNVFSQRMCLGFHDDANVNRIGRAFKAVKLALADLRSYYARLKDNRPGNPSINHIFPSPVAEPSWPDHMPDITFTHRMSHGGKLFIMPMTEEEQHSGVYIGSMQAHSSPSSIEVLVKFTAQYNDSAHHILADAGFAPALYACIPLCGGVQMVVMDRVKGEMAWCAEQRHELLPYTVYEDVKSAIDLLHHQGLVFGDLRSPNIMCLPGARMGAMLVDFDWVGKADSARYPSVLNDGLGVWAPGVGRGEIMRKEHDLYLLQEVKALCWST